MPTGDPNFRLSVDQYHTMIRAGILTDEHPVELLEGMLYVKVPKTPAHVMATRLVRRAVERLLPNGWHFRSQDPITLPDSEPEPDGAVVQGSIEDYVTRHPGPANLSLVIEVADSSLDRDRGMKLRAYARAGIAQYWIVNLIDRRLEVFSNPSVAGDAGEPTFRQHDPYPPGKAVSFIIGGGVRGQIDPAVLLPPAE